MRAPRTKRAGVRRGLVLDVETRIDRAALSASGRSGSPRGMPPGLQIVTAGAMLAFEIDGDAACGSFELRSAGCFASGERTLIRLIDRELARLHAEGGVLVTFNGGHDLAMIRLASLRHRDFASGGAARWQSCGDHVHEDLMLDLAGGDPGRWSSLADLSAAFGLHTPGEVVVASNAAPRELAKCETDVVATMALYLHVLSERARSDQPLRIGIPALATAISRRLARSPHLGSTLRSRAFEAFAD